MPLVSWVVPGSLGLAKNILSPRSLRCWAAPTRPGPDEDWFGGDMILLNCWKQGRVPDEQPDLDWVGGWAGSRPALALRLPAPRRERCPTASCRPRRWSP